MRALDDPLLADVYTLTAKGVTRKCLDDVTRWPVIDGSEPGWRGEFIGWRMEPTLRRAGRQAAVSAISRTFRGERLLELRRRGFAFAALGWQWT